MKTREDVLIVTESVNIVKKGVRADPIALKLFSRMENHVLKYCKDVTEALLNINERKEAGSDLVRSIGSIKTSELDIQDESPASGTSNGLGAKEKMLEEKYTNLLNMSEQIKQYG